MILKNKITICVVVVFIMVFLWGLFLTFGLPFFWEDFHFYHLDKEEYPVKIESSLRPQLIIKTMYGFIKEFFVPERLLHIGFGGSSIEQTYLDRPYQFLTFDMLRAFFYDNIIHHRIFKAIFYSVNACLLFLIISRLSIVLAFLGSFLYLTSGETWITLAYSSDVTIYAQCSMLISVLLFFKLLEKKPLYKKDIWLYYSLILIISNFSILTKGDGRELAILFFFTILLFRKKEILLHLPMLTILLLMEIPVLGYISRFFTGTPASPINAVAHNPLLTSESLHLILSNSRYLRIAIGDFLIIALITAFLIHTFFLVTKKFSPSMQKANSSYLFREHTFALFLWAVFVLIGTAMSRSFAYSGPYDWSMLEITFFKGTFIIIFCYYLFGIYNVMKKPYRLIFQTLFLGLIIAQILLDNLPRINRFRGGWGNYFCAMNNAEKYIDSVSSNALVISITSMQYKPFVFLKSNNEIINTNNDLSSEEKLLSNLTDIIEKKYKKIDHKDIFIVREGEFRFSGESKKLTFKNLKIVDGDSEDLYDKFKRFIGKPSKPRIYVYSFGYSNT